MTAKVIINRSRQVGILAKQGTKFVHVIRHTAHGLRVDRLTEDDLLRDWYDMVDYPLYKAVQQFAALASKPRTTHTARRLLEKVAVEILEGSV